MISHSRSQSHAHEADKIVEAIRVLSGTVDQANQHLEMISDVLNRISDEIRWICNNHQDFFRGRPINRLASDPTDPQWAEKLVALNPVPDAPVANASLRSSGGYQTRACP